MEYRKGKSLHLTDLTIGTIMMISRIITPTQMIMRIWEITVNDEWQIETVKIPSYLSTFILPGKQFY